LLENSNDFNVASDNQFADVNSLLAISTNGNALALWEQSDGAPDGSTRKVFSRRYVAGQGWDAATQVPGVSTSSSSVALVQGKLLMDADGNATWILPNFQTRRYSATAGWSTTTFAPANSAGGQLSDAAIDANGNIAMLGIGDNDVLYTTLAAGATAWAAWVDVSNNTTLPTRDAQLAISGTGPAMAIWRERNPGDNNYSVKASRLVTAGWETPQTIETEFTNIVERTVRVAMSAAGNAVAIWAQGNSVYYNLYTAGTGWGTATAIEAASTAGAQRTRLAITPDGRAVATWNTGLAALRSAQFTPGTGWSAPVQVDSYATEISLGISDTGNAVLVYQGPINQTTANFDVVSSRLTFGGAWSTPAPIEAGAGEVKGILFAMNKTGQGVAMWVQDDLVNSAVRNSMWSNLLR
jgi:hypothetical protein